MVRREIPSLRVLCLRSVGAHACNAETTFCQHNDKPSTASRLLRSFHDRENSPTPLTRSPCVGPESTRRANANDVDLNHPFVACRSDEDDSLVMMYSNPALDCLQSYLDSLVELGRMDDTRLGVNFFREWKYNVQESKKRKRSPSLGAISLHNWTLSNRTIRAMVESGMGEHVGVLDLTGAQGLTDALLLELLPSCPNLVRLSLKGCRRITKRSLQCVAKHLKNLTCLDVGGSYNLTPMDVLDTVQQLPDLVELHASGLAWTDATLLELVEMRSHWTGLSIGFSKVTGHGLRTALPYVKDTLTHLSLAFMETAVDNALVGFLGKTSVKLTCLDVRGNSSLSTLTGFFDGRHFIHAEAWELFVLARYSNIQPSSVEETKRIHPLLASNLTCITDSGGNGGGIRRKMV